MRKRRDYSTFEGTAEVEVLHDEVVQDISDEILIGELARRNKKPPENSIEEILHLLYRNRPQEAIVYLERMLWPGREISASAYEKAKQTRDPQTGRPLIT